MHFDFKRYVQPLQMSPCEHSDGLIDLLPAFRACYPRCIDTSILAIRLYREKTSRRWFFHLVSLRGVSPDVPVSKVIQHDEDFYEFDDMPEGAYPWELLYRIFVDGHHVALQESLGIFSEDAFMMMERIRCSSESVGAERQFARLDFFREVAVMLSEYLAKDVDLVNPTISDLKNSEAHGMRDMDSRTRWHEVMDEATNPSLLYQQTRDDVWSVAWNKFNDLPRAMQIAIWFHLNAEEEYPAGDRSSLWDTPDESLESYRLFGIDDLIDDATRSVMASAEDESWQQASLFEGVDQTPED